MSLELLKNKGVVVARPANSQCQKTIIVVGVARGGTSIVAGALYHLGVPMGNAAAPVFEDLRLSLAFEKQSKEKFEHVIDDYNLKHNLWAWKRPSTLHALAKIARKVRNPHFIFVFRDMLSVANRNNISMHRDVGDGLVGAMEDYRKIVKFFHRSRHPALLVSSEKVVKNKEGYAESLAEFCGIEPMQSQLEAVHNFLSPDPSAYLASTRVTQAKGEVDTLAFKAGIVRGWACYNLNHREAQIEILINGELVASQVANRFDESYKQPGKHPTGHCGFEVDIKRLGARPTDKVVVRAKDDVIPLHTEDLSLDDFSEWISEQELKDSVKPMGGLNHQRLPTGYLVGWARTERPDKHAIIGIYVNGTLFAQIPARLYRSHIKESGIHPTGCCGYEFNLKAFGVLPSDELEVRVENAKLCLHQAPISFPELNQWMTSQELKATNNQKLAQG